MFILKTTSTKKDPVTKSVFTILLGFFVASCAPHKTNRVDQRSSEVDIEYDQKLKDLWSKNPHPSSHRMTIALTDSPATTNAIKILEENCFGCHGANGVALGGLTNITDKNLLINSGMIVPGQPDQSPLLSRLLDQSSPMPPRPAPPLNSQQIQALRSWVVALASPPSPAPTTPVPTAPAPTPAPAAPSPTPAPAPSASASEAIQILKQECGSCHGPGGLGLGGLTNITDTNYLVINGHIKPGNPAQSRLLIRSKDTVNPMPPAPAAHLTGAQIKTLEDWVTSLGTPAPQPATALTATQILQQRCYPCHGAGGNTSGGITDITNKQYLIDSGKLVPGKPEASPIYLRANNAEKPMPPPPKARLSSQELVTLKDWITQLKAAPPTVPPTVPPTTPPVANIRKFITLSEEFQTVLNDLRLLESRNRNDARNTRYLSMVPLANAGQSDIKLKEHANALSRTLNHLSYRSQITKPVPINADQTIFRINLRDYNWSANDWNRITRNYPYRELFPDREFRRQFQQITGEISTLVRADWFALHATQPEFYNLLLNIPNDLDGAERLFRFDLFGNIAREAQGTGQGTVMRSGFLKSGVSLSNRVIERHQINNGAFWISYDFQKIELIADKDQSVRKANIFAAPLGPKIAGRNPIRGSGEFGFEHTAGEVIATLPNGLFWYLLINNQGKRVDIAPTNIVADPTRPEGIINGHSCMNCHAKGLLPKKDEIRANIDRMTGLSRDQRIQIQNLYPQSVVMDNAMARDNNRYRAAITAASIHPTLASPSVLSLAESYEGFVTAAAAAAELGITPEAFKDLIEERVSRDIQNQLSPLLAEGGLVPRQLYEPVIDDLLNEIIFGRRR
jgi:mono/diheme cytochrome c family protein